jgi:hypothetical protein
MRHIDAVCCDGKNLKFFGRGNKAMEFYEMKDTGARPSIFSVPGVLSSFVDFTSFIQPYVKGFTEESGRYDGKANLVRTVCQSVLYLNPPEPGDSWGRDFLDWVEKRTEEEDELAYALSERMLERFSGCLSLAVMTAYVVNRFKQEDAGKSIVLSNMLTFLHAAHEQWKREPSLFYVVGVMNPG